MKHTYIIAEAGVNHNGSIQMAKQLIDAAAEAGADAVKFQTFKADHLVTQDAPKAQYQQTTTHRTETQYEMLKKLELSEQDHIELLNYCKQRGINFLSTPFDLESIDLLTQTLQLTQLKISSGEITNAPLLLKAARSGASLIVSTGMSTLEDIEAALGVLAFGYTAPTTESPSNEAFQKALASKGGKQVLMEKVTLLHCTTEYPAPFYDVNLLAMDTLREAFGLKAGFSDHTAGITAPIAAVARGANVIEKHFTLDRNLPGPDHKASLEPKELILMITSIRQVESLLGSPSKTPAPSEQKNLAIARKSIVAARAIKRGELFTESNLAVKRPGGGLSPMCYWDIVGKRAEKDYAPDEQVL
ncbi:N-acetylneuraminate synthase [Paenibacillus piri]|uniref:N-acetylneuraminate synthase n=1 Tax=Paenibacillus piri TaxID=2547395 RepID=A0A4R5KDW0_9BACL|nr:N-acetylneuraminate synthase [Paenibacillus piri]TDF93491.1 N-acetylneuraminate synthase [Paenibacillus piri]